LSDSALALSYIVRADDWGAIAELVACLARQTEPDRIELLVVSRSRFTVPADVIVPKTRVLVVPASISWAAALALGVREATGAIVALGETHVLPSPGWATAVLVAHDLGADVVLPQIVNANPRSPLSDAAFIMDYGRYGPGRSALTPVPTYNATFRRSLLLSDGSLRGTLVPGPALDAYVRSRGADVACVPGAVVAHLNVDRPLPWLDERLIAGVLMAGARRVGWSRLRAAAYAAAFPAIAVVLFRRARAVLDDGVPLGTTIALAGGCLLYAAGEAFGYLGAPSGACAARMERYEMHKRAYVGGTA
jgi:hypothetical protein